jgi:hypothetical protein
LINALKIPAGQNPVQFVQNLIAQLKPIVSKAGCDFVLVLKINSGG